jgi:HEAT repeat protein
MTGTKTFTDADIVAYLTGDLDAKTTAEIAAWIGASESAQRRLKEFKQLDEALSAELSREPPPGMLDAFRQRLDHETTRNNRGSNLYRIAAAVVLLIAGFTAGRLSPGHGADGTELAALQADVRSLQQLVLLNTLQDHSASERLQAIHALAESTMTPDPVLVHGLIGRMNNDVNPNVRYAAILALSSFTDDEVVRAQLVRALKTQEDPLAQIAIIKALTDTGDKAAIAPLRNYVENAESPPDVRRAAEIAMNSLL